MKIVLKNDNPVIEIENFFEVGESLFLNKDEIECFITLKDISDVLNPFMGETTRYIVNSVNLDEALELINKTKGE